MATINIHVLVQLLPSFNKKHALKSARQANLRVSHVTHGWACGQRVANLNHQHTHTSNGGVATTPVVCVCVFFCAGGGHRALILPEPNQKITTEVPNNRRLYYIHLKHDFRSEKFLYLAAVQTFRGVHEKKQLAHVHSSQPPHAFDQLVLSRVARKSARCPTTSAFPTYSPCMHHKQLCMSLDLSSVLVASI